MDITAYLSIVSYAIYGAMVSLEVSRLFSVITGPMSSSAMVPDLLKSIASCDDRAKLEQIIQSIDKKREGIIGSL